MTLRLADAIAAHLAEWSDSPAYVELAVYGTDDPAAIAATLDDFCRRELGAAPAAGLFHQSSIGAVTGIELGDGRRVVVKAHQPGRAHAWLAEVVRVQRHLASVGLCATEVVAGPLPLGHGLAVVEQFQDGGAICDGHHPVIRRALARSLRHLVVACRPLAEQSTLDAGFFGGLPPDRLWPVPHSRLFDFEQPADWIDELARAARARMTPAGEIVIGHGDWRAEHVRFEGEAAVVAYDWDSLCRVHEPLLVGAAAHAFPANHAAPRELERAPSAAEARAFIADYEAARGRPFTAEERRLCDAALVYACAYTARCTWSPDNDTREEPGTAQSLLVALAG